MGASRLPKIKDDLCLIDAKPPSHALSRECQVSNYFNVYMCLSHVHWPLRELLLAAPHHLLLPAHPVAVGEAAQHLGKSHCKRMVLLGKRKWSSKESVAAKAKSKSVAAKAKSKSVPAKAKSKSEPASKEQEPACKGKEQEPGGQGREQEPAITKWKSQFSSSSSDSSSSSSTSCHS